MTLYDHRLNTQHREMSEASSSDAARLGHSAFPVIDLFAGAGGFSLGAARAGFEVRASVEIDRYANETHARNFPNSKHVGLSVAHLRGRDLREIAGIGLGTRFALIGGPPCQGFSEIGRRDPNDHRNDLFGHFMRLVAETRPSFFIAENVPGILSASNSALVARALSQIPSDYVVLPPTKLCAANFGAATSRTRVFFVGYDPGQCNPLTSTIFDAPKEVRPTTVSEALAGLPEVISPSWTTEANQWQAVGKIPPTTFFGLRAQGLVPSGVGDAFCIDALEVGYTSGCLATEHTPASLRRFEALSEGGRDPISKSVRLERSGLCPTLRAGTGSERGSYQAVRPIHPTQPRVITPREAARLQGFPDWYTFHPTKWHSFRQIGNSVSPLVAEGLLQAIKKELQEE